MYIIITHTHTHMYTLIHVRTHTHTHTHTHTYTYALTYIHPHTHTCTYSHTHTTHTVPFHVSTKYGRGLKVFGTSRIIVKDGCAIVFHPPGGRKGDGLPQLQLPSYPELTSTGRRGLTHVDQGGESDRREELWSGRGGRKRGSYIYRGRERVRERG